MTHEQAIKFARERLLRGQSFARVVGAIERRTGASFWAVHQVVRAAQVDVMMTKRGDLASIELPLRRRHSCRRKVWWTRRPRELRTP